MLTNKTFKLFGFSVRILYSIRSMSTSACKIAVCQFTAMNNKENNLNVIKNLVNEAVRKDVKMVFLPEGCDYIGRDQQEILALSEPLCGPLMNEYRNIAKERNIWLSVGGFHEKDDQNNYNSHVLIDDKGEVKSIYRKVHLFDVVIPEKNINLRESNVVCGGSEILPPVNTPAGRLALAICYDVRFPELSTLQRKMGADILTFPSAFTHITGEVHWELLLRTRAVENQCYVVAAAQYGRHNDKRISYGHSMIVDPWGRIIAECAKYTNDSLTNESIAIADVDKQLLERVRQEMPVIQHRRADIYNLNLVEHVKMIVNDEETYKFADKIIPGSTVFYKTQYSYAFTNIRCVVPGHVLVTSLRSAARLENLNAEEVADLFTTSVKVQKAIEQEYCCTSSTLCVQDGKDAGQTVSQVHVHILPRKLDDFDKNDDVYDCLAKHDRDDNPQPFRSIREMSDEAKKLRKYFSSC